MLHVEIFSPPAYREALQANPQLDANADCADSEKACFPLDFPSPRHPPTVQTQKQFEAVSGLACTMFQRTPLDPDAAARSRPGARDGRQTLARQQQWFHLLAQRAATIQFGLPVDWTGLCDRCKRQEHHCSERFLHVSSGITLCRAHDLNLCAHAA
jgi:hypothetical protein